MKRGDQKGLRNSYLAICVVFILILPTIPFNLPQYVSAQGPEDDIVLNELMVLPQEKGAWVEIHNTGNESVSLDDWLISDEDGLTFQLPDLPNMPPGSYVVVHFDYGDSDTFFGQSQVNALHLYTGWKNVRFTRHIVDIDEKPSRCALGNDIITGGKPEILVNKFKSGKFFYESKPDMSDEWIKSDINAAGDPSEVHRIKPIDVDSDGITDIVAIYCFVKTIGDERLYWIKSPPNPKNNWGGPYEIDDMEGLVGLDAGNINGDNLMDVVVSQSNEPNHNIFWYECPADPTADIWPKYTIDESLKQPGGLVLADLDEDGDMDVVACALWGEELMWYEHPGNPTLAWPKHIIATPGGPSGPAPNPQFDAIGELIVKDLDSDGNQDVIITEGKGNKVVWYRYSTTPFDTWTQHIIDGDILGPSGLDVGDIDGDGDLDLTVAATSGAITWYPQPKNNIYNSNWPRYFVDDLLHLSFYVNVTDLDNDGDLDITTADQSEGKVYWYKNEFLNFTLQDQCALFKAPERTSENIVDFVAWGGPSSGEDILAVDAGIWQTDSFVDMTNATLNKTLARNRFSLDSDVPGDWDAKCGDHSDIPTPGSVNYPYPTNIGLAIEYNPVGFTGGGLPPQSMPQGLCLANYSSYTFRIEVNNPFGWQDLEWMEVTLDYGGADIAILWTQLDDNFTLYNAYNYLILISEECSCQTDGIYTWSVNFTLYFCWSYPIKGMQNTKITSQNYHGYQDADIYYDSFQVVKTLRFEEEMLISVWETQKVLDEGDWVVPGTELQVTGPIVIYDVESTLYYPLDSQFNVLLSDSLGNSWVDYTSSGYSVNFRISVPDNASSGVYNLTLSLCDVPQGALAAGELSYQLFIDADAVVFENPQPKSNIWQTNSTVLCGVHIIDFASGVEGETVEYRLANGSAGRFGEWQPAPISGTQGTMVPSQTINLTEGPNNWIQWRAKDAAGNGPTSSPKYQIPVDTQGVTYHDFYPSPLHMFNQTNVTINITMADFKGSGVNVSSIQMSLRSSGATQYGDWFEPKMMVINETSSITDSLPCGPEMVRISIIVTDLQNGTENYIRFRALDMAGNGYTESEEFNIRVFIQKNAANETASDDETDDSKPDGESRDYWPWIWLLLIILVIIIIITIWNYHRLQRSLRIENKKESEGEGEDDLENDNENEQKGDLQEESML